MVMLMEAKYYDLYKRLGLNIAYYRKLGGYSQMEFAELLNISRTHMSRIETAECAPSMDLIFGICGILNIAVEKLFELK